MDNEKMHKSTKVILILNTCELILGMFFLVNGYQIAAACCLFLLSLNPLFVYPKKEDRNIVTAAIETRTPPINLIPANEADNGQQIELLSFLNDFLQEYDSSLSALSAHTIIQTAADQIMVQIPPFLLRLAFLNIMDNTLKYLPKSGTITITLSLLDTQALLIWKDNGSGVDDCEVPNLLNLNYQGPNRLHGTGLGLSQTQAAIESGGGTIYLKSSPGKGFAIYLHLPLVHE